MALHLKFYRQGQQHRPAITAPIARATSIPQLQEIVEGAQMSLSAEEIEKLDTASAY
jgi:aryl-alcohol dehydrogenase-like predicted oxidoreductase